MKKKLLSIAASIMVASIFFACSSNGVSSADVNSLINGPNSIKGTISGTMLNDTAFSFPYDYSVTTNDGNSYSESWIENDGSSYAGDSVLWIYQYFYFDRNGYDDYGDSWSPSGKYLYFEAYIDMATMKLMPHDYSGGDPYLEGMWQNITPQGNRFVYGLTFNSNTASGTMDMTNMKYDKATQLLSGKLNITLPSNHTQNSWYSNYNATTIVGDFKFYVPKETFQVSKKSSYYGMIFRKRAK